MIELITQETIQMEVFIQILVEQQVGVQVNLLLVREADAVATTLILVTSTWTLVLRAYIVVVVATFCLPLQPWGEVYSQFQVRTNHGLFLTVVVLPNAPPCTKARNISIFITISWRSGTTMSTFIFITEVVSIVSTIPSTQSEVLTNVRLSVTWSRVGESHTCFQFYILCNLVRSLSQYRETLEGVVWQCTV